MYTKRIYSPKTMLLWTRQEIVLFLALSAVPVVLYDVLEQRWLHLPWLSIALVGTAVAFILAFQNNATYDRIWEARKIWGGIVNTSRAWGIQVKDFVTDQFTEEPVEPGELRAVHRRLILRHVAWMTALRHALRAPRPWEGFKDHRTNREWSERILVHEHHHSVEEDLEGYLPDDERAAVCGQANPAAQILALQSADLRGLRARGLIEDFRHMELENLLVRLYEHQGKSERIKNFPYPRQYATLNSLFVWIFLLLIPFGLVHEFDHIGEEIAASYPRAAGAFVWLSVPFSTVVMWVFHTMERIGRVGENPFEGSANDVPITTMARGIEIDLREMIGDDPADIPPPIEPRHGTQL